MTHRKHTDLSKPQYMLHHKPYSEDWRDVILAAVIGVVLGVLAFHWLAT